jgi:carbon storage regulator
MINENIEVTIVSIKGDHVKIGIKAPENVKVYRSEIFEEIQKANREALNIKPDMMKNITDLFNKNKKD